MKTTPTRTVAALLALLVCLGSLCALSGCADTGTPENSTEDTSSAVAEVTDAPEVTVENALSVLGPRNFGGETVTFFSRYYNGAWISDLVSTADDMDTVLVSVYKRNKFIEENYGVKIEEIRSGSAAFQAKVASRVSTGDDSFDVLYMGLSDCASTASAGYLTDLNEIKNLDLEGRWWSQSLNSVWSIGGKQFFATGDITTTDNMATRCMYFNKDIAEKHSLKAPYDCVADNTWTFETFFKMVSEAGILTGDGKDISANQYGAVAQTTFGFMMLMAADELLTKNNSEDIPELVFGSDRSYAIVDYLTKNISGNTAVWLGDDKDIMEIFSGGRSLFMAEVLLHAKTMRDKDVTFGILPMPKYTADQEDYCQYTTGYCTTVIAFPKTTTGDRLDRASFITEAMAIQSLTTVTPAFYEVCLKARYSDAPEDARMIDIISATVKSDLAEIYGWGGLKTKVQTAVSDGSSIVSVLTSSKKLTAAAIKQTVEAWDKVKGAEG